MTTATPILHAAQALVRQGKSPDQAIRQAVHESNAAPIVRAKATRIWNRAVCTAIASLYAELADRDP